MSKTSKMATILLLTAAMFLSSTNQARSYAIYDWVTKGVNAADDGFAVKASFQITDNEFAQRRFFIPWGEYSKFTGSYEIPFTDGTLAVYPFWYLDYSYMQEVNPNPMYVGELSADRKQITNLSFKDGSFVINRLFVDGGVDCFAYMTSTTAFGLIDPSTYFRQDLPHPITGADANCWDQYGEWVLREENETVVPEPGTWMLVAAGLGTLALFKTRRHARSYPL